MGCWTCKNRCITTGICSYPKMSNRCDSDLSVTKIMEIKKILRIRCLTEMLKSELTEDEHYGYGRHLCGLCTQHSQCNIEELVVFRRM